MEIITEAVRNLLYSEDSPTLETSVETEARIAMDRYFNSPNKDPYVAFDYMRNRFAAEVSSDAEASYQVNRKLLEEGLVFAVQQGYLAPEGEVLFHPNNETIIPILLKEVGRGTVNLDGMPDLGPIKGGGEIEYIETDQIAASGSGFTSQAIINGTITYTDSSTAIPILKRPSQEMLDYLESYGALDLGNAEYEAAKNNEAFHARFTAAMAEFSNLGYKQNTAAQYIEPGTREYEFQLNEFGSDIWQLHASEGETGLLEVSTRILRIQQGLSINLLSDTVLVETLNAVNQKLPVTSSDLERVEALKPELVDRWNQLFTAHITARKES